MSKKEKNIIFKRIALAAPLLVVGLLFSFGFAFTAWASGIAPADVIALANSSRAKEGLKPLSENARLSEAARNKAEDMLKNDYFAHTSPKGITPWSWIKQEGYQYKAAGENLAINFTDAKEQHSAWMKSASHRANIMNAQYQEIGVAVVKGKIDGQESIVTVEMFGTPLYAAVDRTTPVPPVVQKAPAEVKGTEIQTEAGVPLSDMPTAQPVLEDIRNVSPVLPAENFVPQKSVATVPAGAMTWLDISWLVFIAILGLTLIAPAAAFFFKAYASLATAVKAKNTEMTEAIETIQTGKSSLLEHHLRI